MFHKLKPTYKVLTALLISAPILTFATTTFAAAPDGLGPWADEVVTYSQGLTKNGEPVQLLRSNPTAALGIAEETEDEGTFYSLGLAGSLTLKFQNGISQGALVVETTWEDFYYPTETAKVEVSIDGVTYTEVGNVTKENGEVSIPEGFGCAQFMRITDTSNSDDFPNDVTTDGFDVDGVQAIGETCDPTPTPTPPTENLKSDLSVINPDCSSDQVKAFHKIKINDKDHEGMGIVFKYNGKEQKFYTGSNGEAVAFFTYTGDGYLDSTPDGWPNKSQYVTKETDCSTGEVLGTSTEGQVLGATTYAQTGIVQDMLMTVLGLTGTGMFTTGTVLHVKKRA